MHPDKPVKALLSVMLMASLVACGGGGGGNSSGGGSGSGSAGSATSSQARFTFNCDLQGLNGELTMDIEAIGNAGVVWGSGSNPDITGVISTGSVTYYTSGSLSSATAFYVFTGENQFADFTDTTSNSRFLVQWRINGSDLTIVVNPYGSGPTQHQCVQTGSRYL